MNVSMYIIVSIFVYCTDHKTTNSTSRCWAVERQKTSLEAFASSQNISGDAKIRQWIWLQYNAPSFLKSLQSFNILDDLLCPRTLAPTPRCSNLQGDVQRAKFANLSWCPDPLQHVQRCSAQIDLHVYWKRISIWQVLSNSFEGAGSTCSNASMIKLIRRCVARCTLWPNVGAWLRPIGGGQGLGFAVIQTRQNLSLAQPGATEWNMLRGSLPLGERSQAFPICRKSKHQSTKGKKKHTVLMLYMLQYCAYCHHTSRCHHSSNFWSTEWSFPLPVANRWLRSFHSTNLDHQCHRIDQSHSSCLWERLACTKWCPWSFVLHHRSLTQNISKYAMVGAASTSFG